MSSSSIVPQKRTVEELVETYRSAVHDNPFDPPPSIRQLARDHVPKSTLAARINGRKSRKVAQIAFQTCTPEQEDIMVEHICRMCFIGRPPAPELVRAIAYEIRRNRLLHDPPGRHTSAFVGQNWVENLRNRHPEMKSIWAQSLETMRATGAKDAAGATRETIQPWFNELGALLDKHRYKSCNIYNMDETGYGMGMEQPTQIIHDSAEEDRKAKSMKLSEGQTEWVSTLECIRADGTALSPMVIYKAEGHLNPGWIPNDSSLAGWMWKTSKTGWTNDYLELWWLEYHLIPLTQPFDTSDRRLLLVDGYSIQSAPFIALCIQHNIDLMVILARTAHIMQPLDIAIFGQLKRMLAAQSNMEANHAPGPARKQRWAIAFAMARQQALSKRNIDIGWKNAGISPFTPAQVIRRLP